MPTHVSSQRCHLSPSAIWVGLAGALLVAGVVFPCISNDRAVAPTDQSILSAQRKLLRSPHDTGDLLVLGDAYARKGRETGDASYFAFAENTLRKAVELNRKHGGSRRHLAYVLSLNHDFSGAVEEARKAVALDPRDSDALGVLGDGLLELGEYRAAEEAYGHMLSIRENLASLSRVSGLRSIQGDWAGAVALLTRAIDSGKDSGESPESIAWAQWQLGMENLNLGRIKKAKRQFDAALATFPNYYRATAGLAQVRVAQGDYCSALLLYQEAMAVIPLPEYAIALGQLHERLRQPQEAQKQYDFVDYLAQLSTQGKSPYARQFVMFYLDRDIKLEEALQAAEKELSLRKDIFGYDLYAWALFRTGAKRRRWPR